MNEMVERVARVLGKYLSADHANEIWQDIPDAEIDYISEVHKEVAHALIEAMREPTAEMINKGIDCPENDIKIQWQAMIDEALK